MEEMNNIYEAEVIESDELVPMEVEEDDAGMSTGLAMAIGGILTAGLIVVGKKAVTGGKQLYAKYKANKAAEPTKEGEGATEADSKPVEE